VTTPVEPPTASSSWLSATSEEPGPTTASTPVLHQLGQRARVLVDDLHVDRFPEHATGGVDVRHRLVDRGDHVLAERGTRPGAGQEHAERELTVVDPERLRGGGDPHRGGRCAVVAAVGAGRRDRHHRRRGQREPRTCAHATVRDAGAGGSHDLTIEDRGGGGTRHAIWRARARTLRPLPLRWCVVTTTIDERALAAAWRGRLEALADTSVGGRTFCPAARRRDRHLDRGTRRRSARAASPGAQVRADRRGRVRACRAVSPQRHRPAARARQQAGPDRTGRLGDLVPHLGRRTQARSRRAHRRRAAGAGEGRSRHRHRPAHGPRDRRRRAARRPGGRSGSHELDEAPQALAGGAAAARARTAGQRGRRRVHPRARREGRARRHPRRPIAVVGGRRRAHPSPGRRRCARGVLRRAARRPRRVAPGHGPPR
jgi:hypothetical protein